MIRDELPLTISHTRLHRILRAGACPVLEITVIYPCLCTLTGEDDAPPVARFNAAYRTMAEKLMAWGEGTVYGRVMAEFEAVGAGAAYGFDRRLLVCDMSAALPSEDQQGSELVVTRNLRLFSRRGGVEERCLTASDHWRLPSLTLFTNKILNGERASGGQNPF